jgi:AcrR family transcriptional regulator
MTKPLPYLRKSPRQPRAAATLEAIVEAAAHILREKGARGLTTNAIAARAGASIGSLYQYFPDKQAIVRALVEREFERVEAARPVTIDGDGAKADIVRAIVDWHFDIRGHDPRLALNLGALIRTTLPIEEQQKIMTLRHTRVARTVAKLLGPFAPAERRAHAPLIIDVCINAIADEALKRQPDLLKSASLRAEVTALLLGYLR